MRPADPPNVGRDRGAGAEAMPRAGRLTRRPEYQRVSGAGRRFNTDRMTVQGLGRGPDGASGLRVGLTVTKRVGHATERNRIKRRLRAAVLRLGADTVALAADLVVVARRPALHAPFSDLVADLARAAPAVARPRPAGEPPPRGGAPRRRPS